VKTHVTTLLCASYHRLISHPAPSVWVCVCVSGLGTLQWIINMKLQCCVVNHVCYMSAVLLKTGNSFIKLQPHTHTHTFQIRTTEQNLWLKEVFPPRMYFSLILCQSFFTESQEVTRFHITKLSHMGLIITQGRVNDDRIFISGCCIPLWLSDNFCNRFKDYGINFWRLDLNMKKAG